MQHTTYNIPGDCISQHPKRSYFGPSGDLQFSYQKPAEQSVERKRQTHNSTPSRERMSVILPLSLFLSFSLFLSHSRTPSLSFSCMQMQGCYQKHDRPRQCLRCIATCAHN